MTAVLNPDGSRRPKPSLDGKLLGVYSGSSAGVMRLHVQLGEVEGYVELTTIQEMILHRRLSERADRAGSDPRVDGEVGAAMEAMFRDHGTVVEEDPAGD